MMDRSHSRPGMPEKRDEMLARLLTAGLDTSDRTLLAQIESDPTLMEDCRAVLALEEHLEARARVREADMAAAVSAPEILNVDDILRAMDNQDRPPGSGPVASTPAPGALTRKTPARKTPAQKTPAQKTPAQKAPSPTGPTRNASSGPSVAAWRWAALAATVMTIGWFAFQRGGEDRPAIWTRTMPLGAQIELLTPLGDDADLTQFAWKGTLGPGQYHVVLVYDLDGTLLQTSPDLHVGTWTCEALSGRTREIVWQVIVKDEAGNTFPGPRQRAGSR